MKSILLSFSFLISYNVLYANEVFRIVTVNEAKSLSKNLDRNIFVYYYEDNCTFCDLAEDSLFANQEIKTYLSEYFVSIKANYKNTVYESWYKEYKVTCLPTMQIITPLGEVIAEIKGIATKDSIMSILTDYKDLIIKEVPESIADLNDSISTSSILIAEDKYFYTVQLGAFRYWENISRYKNQLEQKLNTSLTIFENKSDGLYRLFSGRFEDREGALRNLSEINAYNLEYWIRDVQTVKSFYELNIEQ